MTDSKRLRLAACTAAALVLTPSTVSAAVAGRAIDEGFRSRLTFNLGDRSPIEGGVQETERPLNDIRDQITPEEAESFTFAELGLDESETTYGLSFEHQWKWVTLFVNGTYMEASADGSAPRDLFIGVKDARFDGVEYNYQRIPQGTAYASDIDLLTASFRTAITPVTLNPGGSVEFVPWIVLGLYTLAGQFDIDAGPALGIQEYENPPRLYVVGGTSEGEAAAFAPEIGAGGELLFRVGPRARLTLQGSYVFAQLSGSTSDLGVNSRNEKDIDLDYEALDARLYWEIPLNDRLKLLVGGEYRRVEVDALAEAKDRTPEETLERREKFNKNVDLAIETVTLSVGLRW
jgi:hypothetical protein